MKEITSAKCHRVGHIATSLVASKGRTDKPGEFELRGFLLDPYDYSTGQPFRRVMEWSQIYSLVVDQDLVLKDFS